MKRRGSGGGGAHLALGITASSRPSAHTRRPSLPLSLRGFMLCRPLGLLESLLVPRVVRQLVRRVLCDDVMASSSCVNWPGAMLGPGTAGGGAGKSSFVDMINIVVKSAILGSCYLQHALTLRMIKTLKQHR